MAMVHFGKLQVSSHVPFIEEWLPCGSATIKTLSGALAVLWERICPLGMLGMKMQKSFIYYSRNYISLYEVLLLSTDL